ncbi:glycoside hydrolase family 31 protein [Ornithinimicrobium sediminis]|uniref:glycoside hydrolase family 31 protein n=1 Tax=Ornithinimicrobium sediminis TaxID=2904603 RepID=UPI001E2B80C5|nr:TIM-barrel domain-containing protein [Ornithinimicrobium sediminis]MCE0487308.1 glycoside hydrolase family 31 protein [Ornithinimicrobium sediminis]
MQTVHRSEHARISVLTPHLVRLEWSPGGSFEDRPTLMVVDRDLGPVEVQVSEHAHGVEVVTEGFHLSYDDRPFSPSGLSLQVRGGVSNYRSVWRYGEEHDPLPGTARTLDEADGAIPLEPGIVSRNGFADLDDSAGLVRGDDGTLHQRPEGTVDVYVFTHGRDYRAALQDFHRLTGPVPLVPRFALGNWWSRYHPYSADEYTALLDRFAAEGMPFSVAVLDMDWHLVDVDSRHGSGWTGYTWNRDLFPDPPAFLADLHQRGLRVTLNDHPADGVRAFEDAYPAMAEALGVDPATEAPLTFDVTDEAYLQAFFAHVAHPMEDDGVDFWWVDWQQGPHSRLPGLDPLWALNERHFAELESTGRRPMVFSRYAGPGSHRYPVGFSGDTIISWESLAFQPEFTASAANIGYGWWSHDIGGHMLGVNDDELAVRWVQAGVWSPVLRLHSAASPFQTKEPWRYGRTAARVMTEQLRLRHRLVPYLYTMAERATHGIPLVEPVYHRHPHEEAAYAHRATFFFGSELLVAPVVSPMDRRAQVARADLWLPSGTWFDLETGLRYTGGRTLAAYRDLEHTPVLARAGAILPLVAEDEVGNGTPAPQHLHLRVFAGADGELVLYEDDGAPQASVRAARTPLRLDWSARTLTVGPVEGAADVVPPRRTWTVEVVGSTGTTPVVLADRAVTDAVTVQLPADDLADNPVRELVFRFLDAAHIEFATKDAVWDVVTSGAPTPVVVSELQAMDLGGAVLGRLTELLTAT